jgi:hypothetical protein
LFSIFLTDWPEPEINTHTTVLLVDDAATVTIYSDAGSASARHGVPPRLKAEIVGIVMRERKRKGVRRRNHATNEFRFASQSTSLPQRYLRR